MMNDWIIFSFGEIESYYDNNGIIKKKLTNLPPQWQKFKESKINYDKKNNSLGVLTGKINNIIILDFDKGDEVIEKYEYMFPELKDCPRVKTRKGCHFYFQWSERCENINKNHSSKFGEVLGNGMFAIYPDTKYKLPNGEIAEYKWINKSKPFKMGDKLYNHLTERNTGGNKEGNDGGDYEGGIEPYWVEILNNISVKYFDEYTTWFQILCACSNLGEELGANDAIKKIANELSKQSNNYGNFNEYWENAKKHEHNYTGGTLKWFSRNSNPENYMLINKIYVGDDKLFLTYNEDTLKDYFFSYFGDNIICCRNRIFVYHNKNWIMDKDGSIIKFYIMKTIKELYYKLYNIYNEKHLKNIEDIHLKKQTETLYKLWSGFGNQKVQNVYGILKNDIISKNSDEEIFDKNGYLFCFKNKAYDFKLKKFRDIEKFDYVLTTTKKNYNIPTEEQKNKIKEIIEDIFPDKEMRNSYISILKTGLIGIRSDKFNVATGGGRNGKGVLNELFRILLGDYFCTLPITSLSKDIKTADSALVKLHNARTTKFTEPDKGTNEKLRISNIKTFTGEATIPCRDLYQSSFDMNIVSTYILECNTKPNIDFEGNEAEGQRFNVIQFITTFTNDEDKLKEKNFKKIIPEYTTEDFKENHRCALFDYLINYKFEGGIFGEIYINEKSKTLTQNWFNECNIVYNWFQDKMIYKEGSSTKLKELFDEYKESDIYRSDTKAERRKYNYTYFRSMLKEKLKNIQNVKFLDKNETFNGKQVKSEIICNYVLNRETPE